MSSQRGNVTRTRPQKHQNRTAYKNALHDTSKRTKMINSLEISSVCKQCKEVLDWKIKYKKYKPLTQPKTCVNCKLKSIKFAYHTLCDDCGKTLSVCCKCRQPYNEEKSSFKSKEEVLAEMEGELKLLPERKKRAFHRYLDNLYKPKKKNNGTNSEELTSEEKADEEKVKEREGDNDSNPDYFELVRRRLELLGRDVVENGEEDFDDFNDELNNSDSSD